MKKLLKKIASRILRQEIEAMNKDLYRLKQQVYGQKKIILPQGAVSCSEIRIVADDRKEKPENGLMIELMDFKLKIFIPLACTNNKFNGGIGAEVNTWVWDFYRAGIKAVGDRDFQMITEFLSASARVLS